MGAMERRVVNLMKKIVKKIKALLMTGVLITLSVGIIPLNVSATPVFDPSFENALPTTVLDASQHTGAFTYTTGDSANWEYNPNGSKMAVLMPVTVGNNYSAVQTQLQMTASDIAYIDANFNSGSGSGITNMAYLYADVSLNAGEEYHMAWNYSSTDYIPYNDGSFATFENLSDPTDIPMIDNVSTTVAILGATVAGTGNYTTGSYGSTGWQTIVFKAGAAGTYRIGFTAFNLDDTQYSPYLFLDDAAGVTLKNGTPVTPVPKDTNAPAPAGPSAYTVTYDANYGTGTVPTDGATYISGASVTIASGSGLSKSGATFGGWSITRDGTALSGSTFSMPGNNVTLYAVWNAVSTPAATTSTSSVTTTTTTTTREAQVNGIDTQDTASVSTVDVTRSEDNGRTTDSVIMNQTKTGEVLQKVLELGRDTMQIYVDGNNGDSADEVAIHVNAPSVSQIAANNISLEVKTDDISIQLPNNELSEFGEAGNDLYFRLIPLKSAEQKAAATSQVSTTGLILATGAGTVEVIGTPMTIETNYQNFSATVIFPLSGIELPMDPTEREAFLANVGMFINHEDGSQELLKGTIIYNASGYPIGIAVPVTHFSTFTMVKMDTLSNYFYNTHMQLGVIKSKKYANKIADIYRTEYDTSNVTVVKKGGFYVVSADFTSADAANEACQELISQKMIIPEILRQYFINHPQSIDKYTFLQNSAFTHWVKEKCSKMC